MKVVSPGRARRRVAASSVTHICLHMCVPCVLASHPPIAPGSTNVIM
jgi:hypothetical protein